ncbi:MAG: hypothetical protein ACK417_08395 [Bacteroidia bacterium]|jgi:membrane-bound ClpP family serine protease
MMLTIIFLISLGLLLLFAELFIVPGVTVLGIAGMIFLGFGVWFVYDEYGLLAGNSTLALTLVLSLVVLIRSFKSRFWENFELKSSIDSKVNIQDPASEEVVQKGDVGVSLSALRPTGTARFGKRVREVELLNGLAGAGETVIVSHRDGNKIYVKRN